MIWSILFMWHIFLFVPTTGTKLVTLKAGSANDLRLFLNENLFMFAISKNSEFSEFTSQFPDIDILDPNAFASNEH